MSFAKPCDNRKPREAGEVSIIADNAGGITLPASSRSPQKNAPRSRKDNMDTSLDWMIAAGIPAEEMEQIMEKEKRAKEITDCYEKAMGYNPLPWNKLEPLKRFLLTKSPAEIKQFAAWSRREYSTFTPAKARLYPEMVRDLFPQAFLAQDESHGDKVTDALDRFMR
jgi:hypothetical protein